MFANNVLLGFVRLMSVKINKSPTIESESSLWLFDEVQKARCLKRIALSSYESKRKALDFITPLFIPKDLFLY